jgi:hypothetical protein
MNIFVLDRSPALAAQMQCDKHVVKMVLESAQMLSTVARIHGNGNAPYRSTHVHHPCTLWAASDVKNWWWLQRHALALLSEYTFRYDKEHGCYDAIVWSLENRPWPDVDEVADPSSFALAMPDAYKRKDAVLSYRAYYIHEKKDIARWNRTRPAPAWWPTY